MANNTIFVFYIAVVFHLFSTATRYSSPL